MTESVLISSVITAEIVCMIFLLILHHGIHVRLRSGNTSRIFGLTLLVAVAATAVDALSYIVNAAHIGSSLQTLINTLAFGACDVVIISFAFYVWSLVNEKEKTPPIFPIAASVIGGADFIFTLFASKNGWLFIIEKGVFREGKLYNYGGLAALAVAFFSFIYVLFNAKSVGKKTVFAVGSYFVLPGLSFLAGLFLNNVSYSYVAISIVISILYVSLQQDEIEKAGLREQMMIDVSNTDELTGLNNRRAYESRIASFNPQGVAGVIFCDLNGLKVTNDTLGHAAGDKLIIRFSELLKKQFPAKDIFRISGDEFVVIDCDDDERDFFSKASKMKRRIELNDSIASSGKSFGSGDAILTLISEAEQGMYADKNEYYVSRGIDRRKS